MALRLQSLGEQRLLVGMVERWSQLGDPTSKARLAQIRALLDLCMMDRAWTRLQALRTEERHDRTRLELTARMFVERGWPKRARKVLAEAVERFPDYPWGSLQDSADRPPRRAPAEEPGHEATVHERLQVAEVYLATGAYLKARRLLAALEQDAGGDRVKDLLWALRGDYDLHGQTLHELVDRYAPAAGAFGDLPDLDDDPNTDSITVADVPFASSWDGGSGAFPSMFLEGEDDEHDFLGGGDITQSTSVDELDRAIGTPVQLEEEDDDTQVLRVVRNRQPVLYDEFSPPTSPGIVDELEGEDDAVVVLTRRQERQPPHRNEPPLPLETPPQAPAPPPALAPPAPALTPPPPAEGLAPAQIALLGVAILMLGLGTLLVAYAILNAT